MKKLSIWTETQEFATLITGYLVSMGAELIYTKEKNTIFANVSDLPNEALTEITKTIACAKGDNHLALEEVEL